MTLITRPLFINKSYLATFVFLFHEERLLFMFIFNKDFAYLFGHLLEALTQPGPREGQRANAQGPGDP